MGGWLAGRRVLVKSTPFLCMWTRSLEQELFPSLCEAPSTDIAKVAGSVRRVSPRKRTGDLGRSQDGHALSFPSLAAPPAWIPVPAPGLARWLTIRRCVIPGAFGRPCPSGKPGPVITGFMVHAKNGGTDMDRGTWYRRPTPGVPVSDVRPPAPLPKSLGAFSAGLAVLDCLSLYISHMQQGMPQAFRGRLCLTTAQFNACGRVERRLSRANSDSAQRGQDGFGVSPQERKGACGGMWQERDEDVGHSTFTKKQ